MMWFTRVVNCWSSIELSSILRIHTLSQNSLRNISLSPGLKHIGTLAFSPPLCTKHILQVSQKTLPFMRTSSNPFIRTNSLLLHTHSKQNLHGTFMFRFKVAPFTYSVHLFHTQRSCLAKVGSGIQGSPDKNRSGLFYIVAVFILMLGGAYAGVPLYKVFCQATGLGGQAVSNERDIAKIETMKKVDRHIKIRFNADVSSSMRWNFKPQQSEVTVLPGETALAFYTAKNPTDKPIIGISTYNVLPFDAGQYFNKIQCFCFEEQRLNPKEQVDMPVFFFIDPEFAEDPKLEHVNTITLSYTFFEAVDGLTLPLPGYPQPHDPIPTAS